jgi:DNA polymerase III delta prime subunit
MDNHTQSYTIPLEHLLATPAHLWVGQHERVVPTCKRFLQQYFCAQKGCATCMTCTQIEQEQHHAIMWLSPEKGYTIEHIALIADTIIFQLDQGAHYFFIIQKADFLSPLCANRLLKVLEEPPAGYHFILLAQRPDSILPTIRSRCVIQTFPTLTDTRTHSTLFSFFTSKKLDPFLLHELLESSKINERESIELLDELIAFWLKHAKSSLQQGIISDYQYAQKACAVFTHATLQPPMPGSSKLFWKNILLQLHQLP